MAGRVGAVVWQGLVVLLRCWGCPVRVKTLSALDGPKANGTGRHGWWCGCSGLCPISVGWQPFIHGSPIVLGEVDYGGVLVAHAQGKGRVQDGGGQRNPTTSAEVILASVQICSCV